MMPERTGIVCAGNWIVDIIHDIPAYPDKSDLAVISNENLGIGGGAANVALNLAALDTGLLVIPVGVLGDDDHGDTVIRFCKDAKLPIDNMLRLHHVGTAHTHVMNVPGDSRTFFYYPGANDHLNSEIVSMDTLAVHLPQIFYLGYLNLLTQLDEIHDDGRTGAAHLLARAREAGMLTCVDLVSSNNDSYQQTIYGTLPDIDWLFLNEVEAARATGLPIAGETDHDNMALAAKQLLQGGILQGCILHTPKLCLWKTHDTEIWFETPQLPKSSIVSSVGAGDAFAAGVLYGLHQKWTPKESVELGCKMATACLRAPTATGGVPTLKHLQLG